MASSNITVLTSITGGKDHLIEGQTKGNALFIAHTDAQTTSTDWTIKPAFNRFLSPRRNSRVPKMLAHQFASTEYSIWIDGNARLLVSPETLIEKYLANHDLAVFKHPIRDCLYDEATVCAVRKLDDPETIIEQAKTYEDAGYAKHKGLCECGVIIRRHTPKVEQFNNAWWSEFCRHSVRDQISFMYAVDKVGLRINQINIPWTEEGNRAYKADLIELVPHLTPQPEWKS